MVEDDTPAALCRLHAELCWYHESAVRKKRAYRSFKAAEFTIAAAVPLGASMGWATTTIGLLGAAIVVLQGIQQLFQLHAQWLAHRATYESLKKEESLYFAHAGPYRDCDEPDVLLAERTEAIRADETSQWVESELTPHQGLRANESG